MPKRIRFLAQVSVGVLICWNSPQCSLAQAVRWDYVKDPVQVSEVPPIKGQVIDTIWPTYMASTAFDGFGSQGSEPAAVRGWHLPRPPSPGMPAICEIDYHQPVAISAFVHYFYVPGSRDLRFLSPAPSAFRQVRILSRNDSHTEWKLVTALSNLSLACPQVLPVKATERTRYWRLEVLELAPGAEMLMSYEIETYTGGVPHIIPARLESPDLPASFAEHLRTHRPVSGAVAGVLTERSNHEGLDLELQTEAETAHAELSLVLDKKPVSLVPSGNSSWRADVPLGQISIQSEHTPMGTLFDLTYLAKQNQPIKYLKMTLQARVRNVALYYMPAYVWSEEPVDLMVNSANVQTRLAALETGRISVCLVPGTDRGNLGFGEGAGRNELLLGPRHTPVLVTAVAGDWWKTYRFAVREVYNFEEPLQTVPVSEIQYGTSRYMVQAEGVWEPTLGTVRSWPDRDPHSTLYGKGFEAFALYGTPYSVPAYWARYVMSGDELARQRCRSIVRWLCSSGVKVHQGPARGAFFTKQQFQNGETPSLLKQGGSWSPKPVLTSQSTGSALWTLLYYRAVSGEHDQEIDEAIEEAASWLLRTQTREGGWPYGHDLDGKPVLQMKMVDGRLIATSPGSGCIWNVWALWRLGKETGNKAYLEAAERSRLWFEKEFVIKHHYHGYWEDVGSGSREGYEAAIAAIAFGEMGDKELAIETAKDAIQWVFTRQIEPRDTNNSVGLVAEQTGWPPASYCNPMMALAAATAWKISGDEFWRPFAMIPKAIGWWYQPDLGATVWIVDSTQMAPIVGPAFESYWSDWCIAQVGALTLRWLVREVNRRVGESAQVSEESLTGKLLGRAVRAWAPSGGLQPILPSHGQVNWLGFRGDDAIFVVLFNSGAEASVGVRLNSRNVNGVEGAMTWPEAVYVWKHGQMSSQDWNGEDLVHLEHEGTAVLEWGFRD